MRTRTIKPDFFKDEDLIALSFEWRLLFQGLWLLADKDGRLEDKPLRIKYEIFPGNDVDVEKGLTILSQPKLVNSNCESFIQRYEVAGRKYIQITNFKKHQSPHPNEKSNNFPAFNNEQLNYTSTHVISGQEITKILSVEEEVEEEKEVKVEEEKAQEVKPRARGKKEGNKPPDTGFDLFWKAYPRKIGKTDARKAWEKLKPPIDKVLITLKSATQSDEWVKDRGQFVPHPTTWLNRGGWEDEYGIGDENVTRIPIKAEPAPDEQVTKLPIPAQDKTSS